MMSSLLYNKSFLRGDIAGRTLRTGRPVRSVPAVSRQIFRRKKNTSESILSKNLFPLQALPASLLNTLVRHHSDTLRALLPNLDAWIRLASFRPPSFHPAALRNRRQEYDEIVANLKNIEHSRRIAHIIHQTAWDFSQVVHGERGPHGEEQAAAFDAGVRTLVEQVVDVLQETEMENGNGYPKLKEAFLENWRNLEGVHRQFRQDRVPAAFLIPDLLNFPPIPDLDFYGLDLRRGWGAGLSEGKDILVAIGSSDDTSFWNCEYEDDPEDSHGCYGFEDRLEKELLENELDKKFGGGEEETSSSEEVMIDRDVVQGADGLGEQEQDRLSDPRTSIEV